MAEILAGSTSGGIPILDELPAAAAAAVASGAWNETQFFRPEDADDTDSFGDAVAISNDGRTAVVGEYLNDNTINNSGSAYIYEFSGKWRVIARLEGDEEDSAYFGRAVAISGDGNVILVGAYLEDNGANTNVGAAYLFRKDADGIWFRATKFTPPTVTASDFYGFSVALNEVGDIAIISAYGDDTEAAQAGALYTYEYNGTSWTNDQKITADSDASMSDLFANSVAISDTGGVLVAGAPFRDDGATSNAGAAYVMTRNGFGFYDAPALLVASDAGTDDFAGRKVAVSGDGSTIVVSADGDDDTVSNSGAAYVYTSTDGNSTWTQTAKIQAESPQAITGDTPFSSDVAVSGDGSIILIGSKGMTFDSVDSGSAHVFIRNDAGTAWIYDQMIIPSELYAAGRFGVAVAISSDGAHSLIGASRAGETNPTGLVYSIDRY